MDVMPTRDQVLEALKVVIDPELHKDIVTLDMVRSIDIHANGVVDVTVSLTTAGCPIRNTFQTGVTDAVRALDGVIGVNVSFDVLSDEEKRTLQAQARPRRLAARRLARRGQERHLHRLRQGRRRQVLRHREPRRRAGRRGQARRRARRGRVGLLHPAHVRPRRRPPGRLGASARSSRRSSNGIKIMSIGFFLDEDAAVVWRGPMLHKALTQFLKDVEWGELDYLLVDLPPGTGDVSMTLAELLPQAKFLIVTTPQATAQKVARRAAEMADKVKLEVAGIVENMSGFTTPGGERFQIFGEGGGQELADEIGVPLLGKIPLTMPLREQADAGLPLVIEDPDDPGRPGAAPDRPRHHRADADRRCRRCR